MVFATILALLAGCAGSGKDGPRGPRGRPDVVRGPEAAPSENVEVVPYEPFLELSRGPWESWRAGQFPGYVETIALALPQTGRFATAGDAVSAGFNLAEARRGGGYRLRRYDSGLSRDEVMVIRANAQRSGADVLVGPLMKPAVQTLAETGGGLPVLALNYLPDHIAVPSNLFQFGLSPEDEAREVARRARLDGHRSVAIFVPDDHWGHRLAEAYREAFTEWGGRIVAEGRYPPRSDELKRHVSDLLMARSNEALWVDRRSFQYADAVLLGASPRDGRVIKPLLRFHKAGQLPVYATSKIYGAQPNTLADRDLNGIVFCDMPWVLPVVAEQATPAEITAISNPELTTLSPRLIALGMDAAMLVRRLPSLIDDPRSSLNGTTGRLRLLPNNRIYRELDCARFVDGAPERLPN